MCDAQNGVSTIGDGMVMVKMVAVFPTPPQNISRKTTAAAMLKANDDNILNALKKNVKKKKIKILNHLRRRKKKFLKCLNLMTSVATCNGLPFLK